MWPFSLPPKPKPIHYRTIIYHWPDGTTTKIQNVKDFNVFDGMESIYTADGAHVFIPGGWRLVERLP